MSHKSQLNIIHGINNHSSPSSSQTLSSVRLLEDLTVGPIIGLAIDGERLVPGPLVVDELLVLGLVGVELGELVTLPVRSDVESGGGVLAADDEGALDNGVVGLAVYGAAAEDVLARGLKTGKETPYRALACFWILDEEWSLPIKFEVMKVMVSSSLYL